MREKQFIDTRLSHRLEGFRWTCDTKSAFRCPFCGDSSTDRSKTRGGFVMIKNDWVFKCFNCEDNHSFVNALKKFDYDLYREYRLENLYENEDNDLNQIVKTDDTFLDLNEFKSNFQCVSTLPDDHISNEYLNNRFIPKSYRQDIFFSEDFNKSVNSIKSGAVDSDNNKPAIVIPMIWKNGEVFGLQARYFEGSFRYKSVVFDKQFPKTANLHRVDLRKTIHVSEGFFDSTFLPNSIATLDAALHKRCSEIPNTKKDQYVLWFDNEPNNSQVMEIKKKAIDEGYRVVFYPKEFKNKDINDSVMNIGLSRTKSILKNIKVLSGLKARIEHKG